MILCLGSTSQIPSLQIEDMAAAGVVRAYQRFQEVWDVDKMRKSIINALHIWHKRGLFWGTNEKMGFLEETNYTFQAYFKEQKGIKGIQPPNDPYSPAVTLHGVLPALECFP